jgi:hypothetical protein
MAKVVGQRPKYQPVGRPPALVKHASAAHRPVELIQYAPVSAAMAAGRLAGRVLSIAELTA